MTRAKSRKKRKSSVKDFSSIKNDMESLGEVVSINRVSTVEEGDEERASEEISKDEDKKASDICPIEEEGNECSDND